MQWKKGRKTKKNNRPKCWKCTADCKLPTPRVLKHCLNSIDTALCAGDLEKLLKLCTVSYGKLFSSIDSSEDSCGAADSEDAVDQPIRLQQPKLPDLESYLHVEHAELIAEVEKRFLMMQNFPVAAARENVPQRKKQVTAFTFSETKFCSDIWIK